MIVLYYHPNLIFLVAYFLYYR